ncbi:hypothetical protein [Nocardia salmonicida]|uniref:hypothetical protein n=1 Tax=Nocardia salmonicida TaxID=53431 RepID=UPI0007A4A5EE|nr:hypothetical protein [Nocardia salmonicida]
MVVRLGEKNRFAVEVGVRASGLRRVDLWAADQWLTCDDNMVFVEQFRRSVKETAVSVRSGQVPPLPFAGLSPVATHRRFGTATDDDPMCELREQFWFLRWGPTTDNLQTFVFRDGDQLVFTLQFWREAHLLDHPEHVGRVFEVKIEPAEFAGILESLDSAL